MPTTHPPIVSQSEWLAKRLQLLEREKAATRELDRLAAARRALPMVRVEKDYRFEGPNGQCRLVDLFADRLQLVVYHFMFDPAKEQPCAGCSGFVEALGDLSLLAERNTTFALISRAPYAKLESHRRARGWNRPWFSSFGSDFNHDHHVTFDDTIRPVEYNYRSKAEMIARGSPDDFQGEAHGVSVFFRLGDEVCHTYSTYARGVEKLTDSYSLLDLTPLGRQEDWEKSLEG